MTEYTPTPEELEAIRLENEKIAAELAAIPEWERANRQAKARFDYINQRLNTYEARERKYIAEHPQKPIKQ